MLSKEAKQQGFCWTDRSPYSALVTVSCTKTSIFRMVLLFPRGHTNLLNSYKFYRFITLWDMNMGIFNDKFVALFLCSLCKIFEQTNVC